MSKKRHTLEASKKLQSLLLHVCGLTLAVSGAGMLISGVVEAIDGGPDTLVLLIIGVLTLLVGLGVWQVTEIPRRIQVMDVFVTVTGAWIAMAVAGAFPYLLTGTLTNVADAMFESVSGFTTTGATVLPVIEDASQGILFFRSFTQWVGGIGVIVLVVAVLPTVGAGGMDLLEAEAPGPTGERLTPRVRATAQRLWAVYIGFTIVVGAAYLIAGMTLYDAVAHSLTTVSTGGFSPHSTSMNFYESALIEWIAIVAMFLAGTSFILIYRALRGKPGLLFSSAEFQLYTALVVVSTVLILFTAGDSLSGTEGLRDALFSVVTVSSTTGYGTANFGAWNDGAQAILLLLMPLGAMSGSTAGGIKMIRVLAVGSFARREAMKQMHPTLVRPVRIGRATLGDDVTARVLGFLIFALGTFGFGAILISLTGVDLVTSLSASATSFGNVGPGLGAIDPSSDFRALPLSARMIGMVSMLLGRLEIYPVILAMVAVSRVRMRRNYRKLSK